MRNRMPQGRVHAGQAGELASRIQPAEGMAAIPQIKPEGEAARRNRSGRSGNEEGRSVVGGVGFPGQSITAALRMPLCLLIESG